MGGAGRVELPSPGARPSGTPFPYAPHVLLACRKVTGSIVEPLDYRIGINRHCERHVAFHVSGYVRSSQDAPEVRVIPRRRQRANYIPAQRSPYHRMPLEWWDFPLDGLGESGKFWESRPIWPSQCLNYLYMTESRILGALLTMAAGGTALFLLFSRRWLPGIFALLVAYQAVSVTVHDPFSVDWWKFTWAPIELGLMMTAEIWCIALISRQLHVLEDGERYPLIVAMLAIPWAIAWKLWPGLPDTPYASFVLVREYAWMWMAVSLLVLLGFLAVKPNGTPRAEAWIFAVMAAGHAFLGPLRFGTVWFGVQAVFRLASFLCFVYWLSQPRVEGRESGKRSRAAIPDSPGPIPGTLFPDPVSTLLAVGFRSRPAGNSLHSGTAGLRSQHGTR